LSQYDQIVLPDELRYDWEEARADIISEIVHHLENTGAKRVVLGLSGGVDSSVCLALAVQAVGRENVEVLFMPEKGVTPEYDEEDAKAVSQLLGVKLKEIEISPILEEFARNIEELSSLALANTKARIRMVLLYATANNMRDAQVIGTSDKSELLLGYTTKYGDGAADLLPIGDLYKTQVRFMASKLGLPKRVWLKAPSPQLIKGVTAQAELGLPYDVLDRILYYRVDMRYPDERIAQLLGLEPSVIAKYSDMILRSDHKRKAPPIGKLGNSTINVDWRMPIERPQKAFF